MDGSSSRVDLAYDWLLDRISTFRLPPGAPLTETKVADQLGVSRTPVRAALQRLEKEGLVRQSDTARFVVSQITPQEVNDACDMLEALDSYIFRKAAAVMTEEQALRLRQHADDLVAAAAKGDRVAWQEADTGFHRDLNTTAGNELMASTLKETRRRIQRFWLRVASVDDRLAACSREHQVLAEAIISRDEEAINTGVTQHITHMRTSILTMLSGVSLLFGQDSA